MYPDKTLNSKRCIHPYHIAALFTIVKHGSKWNVHGQMDKDDVVYTHTHTHTQQNIQVISVAQSYLNLCDPWTAARQGSLSITNSRCLHKLMSIESVMPSNHLILLSPSPPAFNLSQHQGLFQRVSFLHQVAKVLEFQLLHQFFQWLSHKKKKWNNAICSNMDRPGDEHTKWSQSERDKYHTISLTCGI